MSNLIDILKALLTPTIGVAATLIAYQQYRIKRGERALVLYDRRLAVFKEIISIFERIYARDLDFTEASAWSFSISESKFLFGPEVIVIIQEFELAIHELSREKEDLDEGQLSVKVADIMNHIECFHHPIERSISPYLYPAGSGLKKKKKLTLRQAEKLIPNKSKPILEEKIHEEIEEDVPF